MADAINRIEGVNGLSLHTLGAPFQSVYASPSVALENPLKSQKGIAIRQLGANPLYVSLDPAVSSTNYDWKVQSTDTQSTFISIAENVALYVIGTAAETYRLRRFN